MRVKLTVDGVGHDLDVETRRTLADLLGTECGVPGCRVACSDGTCGACAVVVDGSALRSCLMLAVQAAGAQVDTAGEQCVGGAGTSSSCPPPHRAD
jgi:carbon-monoxide dehydrogenase small subunit